MLELIPAAQYLRASTISQDYSYFNQKDAIREFAAAKGYEIVQTYIDRGRSGLTLNERPGLMSLLSDVVTGTARFKAIIAFDISRWGRFQDEDEGAHYEFICKASGIPVFFCAEPFANDSSMVSMIFKSLKRTMASEFIRHLGNGVFDGQRRLASEGFHIGNCPSYGLRRLLVSSDGKPKQLLCRGERQSINTDRTVLVPGPDSEVAVIRQVFQLTLEGVSAVEIAKKLRTQSVPYSDGKSWRAYMVSQILRNPKYAGINVWNRTTAKLRTVHRRNDRSKWITKPGAFEPIVTSEVFQKVQDILDWRTKVVSENEALDRLTRLLRNTGRLSQSIVEQAHKKHELPWGRVNYRKLGTWSEIYRKLGFNANPAKMQSSVKRSNTIQMNRTKTEEIAKLFRGRLVPFRLPGRFRTIFRVDDAFDLSILTCAQDPGHRTSRWLLSPSSGEFRNITLLCLLNEDNSRFQDYYLVPSLPNDFVRPFGLNAKWLSGAARLDALEQLHHTAVAMHSARTTPHARA